MSDDMNYGRCEKCGKEATLNRIYDKFSFPCACHSPSHFMLHNLCNECYSNFRENPDHECHADVSVDTFNIFLKSHSAYFVHEGEKRALRCEDLNPEYHTSEDGHPLVKITCTYDTMCYLGKLYEYYQQQKRLEETEDK